MLNVTLCGAVEIESISVSSEIAHQIQAANTHHAPMIRGRANIEAVFKKQFEQGGVLQLSSSDSEIAGVRAFASGTFTVTVPRGVLVPTRVLRGRTSTSAGTEWLVGAGKYLTVFTRVGNDWKIAYDMQNADQPPPK